MKKTNSKKAEPKETRTLVIFGFSEAEIKNVIENLSGQLSSNVSVKYTLDHDLCVITILGSGQGIELLRFNMNKIHRSLCESFGKGLLSTEYKSLSEILGHLLTENELSISVAESCTGGNIAHKIVETPGSSAYFLGSIVSYSNNVKAEVLNVDRQSIERNGAVSKEVVEAMATGVGKLMHTDCSIATSGIAGPNGGSKSKPVGTVWIAVKYNDNIISECRHFTGKRNDVIEAATNHAIVMMINYIKEKFALPEESNDE